MSYDIVIRFPSQKVADEFCAQMSDGAGEGFCDFSYWQQIEGTDGKEKEHYEKVTSIDGKPVFFVSEIWI